jgi:putative endonuclease
MKAGFAYIMASQRNGTIYTGSTSNLVQRACQHRTGLIDGFTKENGCTLLVWFEAHDDLQEARRRELQIKKWNRIWKLPLIEEVNPEWKDLYESLF